MSGLEKINANLAICANCKHYNSYTSQCVRNVTEKIDIVTGQISEIGFKYARLERDSANETHCGPDGKFFERQEENPAMSLRSLFDRIQAFVKFFGESFEDLIRHLGGVTRLIFLAIFVMIFSAIITTAIRIYIQFY